MKFATIREIKMHLSEYVERACKGEIVVTKNGKPVALLPYPMKILKTTCWDIIPYLFAQSSPAGASISRPPIVVNEQNNGVHHLPNACLP